MRKLIPIEFQNISPEVNGLTQFQSLDLYERNVLVGLEKNNDLD